MVGTENLNVGRRFVQFYGRDGQLAERVTDYLLGALDRDSAARGIDAFAEVRRRHGERRHEETVGSRSRAARTFALSREAPAAARHFTVATLGAWGAGDLAEDSALVVSELAANTIVHARSAFTVILSVHVDLIRISVRDASPLAGGLRAAPLHGLAAVDALAIRWGVESLGNAGKTVWVDLPR